MYLDRSGVHLKNTEAFAFGDSLTAKVATGADWEREKVVETYEQNGEDVESENGADASTVGNYFIYSEIPEK